MSETALKDINALTISVSEKKSDSYTNGVVTKHDVEDTIEVLSNKHNVSALVKDVKEHNLGTDGTEVGTIEIEYIDSESLPDLPSLDTSLSTLVVRLDSKDWVCVCEALNNVRQISLYHREKLSEMLGDVIPLVVKSLKNPRSAVCKTAIMTCADIFKVYSDIVIDALDVMLVPLLLKASQDKRFVCDAAESALIAMATWISPSLLLPKLLVCLKNKNPRIRAKSSTCFSRSVPRLGAEGIEEYGIDKLIQIAASQLSDQLPESREAAKILALELKSTYKDSQLTLTTANDSVEKNAISWEDFCQTNLSPLSAQAIIRVTSMLKQAS